MIKYSVPLYLKKVPEILVQRSFLLTKMAVPPPLLLHLSFLITKKSRRILLRLYLEFSI